MIKKLDILLLRSFIGPFIVTFFVALFVLVMQFFWLYMDELIGKGLGVWMILKLLFYMSSTMVPLALPLGILLASIITFGNMGEQFELIAIKSSGISLLRFMQPLLIFIIFLGGLAFLFNNNFIPVANLKALSLLYDLRNSKPALNIRPGQFNSDINGFSIRVGEKLPDGKTIRNITIYDHSSGLGNDKVVLAERGEMIPVSEKKVLVFRLNDGWRYEEKAGANKSAGREQIRMHFKEWDKVFDLSSFKVSRTNEDLFKGAYQMMNLRQLNESIDSFKKQDARTAKNVTSYLAPYITAISNKDEHKILVQKLKKEKLPPLAYKKSFMELIPDTLRAKIINTAINQVRNSKGMISIAATDKSIRKDNMLKFNIEWHKKFTLSFACILLFLIGAPLGAIIRKGGLGMPLVIAVSFFVVFFITSTTGEKLAKSASVKAWQGMWMATAMLLPIAFFLINAARKDSQIFTKEWYGRIFRRFKRMFVKSTA